MTRNSWFLATIAALALLVAASAVMAQPRPVGPGGVECGADDLVWQVEQTNGPFGPGQHKPDSPEAGLDDFLRSMSSTSAFRSSAFQRISDAPADHPEYLHLVYERGGRRLGSAMVEPIDGGWLVHSFDMCVSTLRNGPTP